MSTSKGGPLMAVDDYRCRAQERMSSEGWSFYNDASGRRSTYNDSMEAFDRYVIRPRILHDVTHRTLSTTVLGQPISMPICVAPTSYHRYAHTLAEVETAKGAADADTLFVMSCYANASISDVSRAAPGGLKWMQLYLFKDRRISEHVVKEAEKEGFKAIVLTVDLPFTGNRAFSQKRPTGKYYQDPTFRPVNLAIDIPEIHRAIRSGDVCIRRFLEEQGESPQTWDDVRWLKSITKLPIVLKGILTGEAAREAADAGVSGIIVSAHGGRQIDGISSPIDALTEVVSAVKGRGVEVYMDGGVMSGADVLKALGLGARAVLIGKPVLWALACEGSAGVKNVLSILGAELDSALAISGCTSPNEIPSNLIGRKSLL